MHIGPRKVFPSINCIIVVENFDRGELGYRPIWIFEVVNKVHMGARDNLKLEHIQ